MRLAFEGLAATGAAIAGISFINTFKIGQRSRARLIFFCSIVINPNESAAGDALIGEPPGPRKSTTM
jgi:hypothetical protein